jgi:hypothetical protein
MFSVLPAVTDMPRLAVSSAPSFRMRLAVPETVTRVDIVTAPSATYHAPPPQDVLDEVSISAEAQVFCAPLSSM